VRLVPPNLSLERPGARVAHQGPWPNDSVFRVSAHRPHHRVITDLARRRSLLVAALVALRVKQSMRELDMMHRWLDNWGGPRAHRDGHGAARLPAAPHECRGGSLAGDVLTSPANQRGSFGAAATPWGAVQEAAWAAIKDAD
jgi:hypothetical protein